MHRPAAFSLYLLETIHCKDYSLSLLAMAWDYLRDVLMMILDHQFLAVDEPLALLVSRVICHALQVILKDGKRKTGKGTLAAAL